MANQAFNEEISFMTLFPNTEFNNITEAYSVYGAGAFFVELMKIATGSNVLPTKPNLSLKSRRPDLWNLQITQANVDNERPYLEGVNNLLLSYIKNDWANFANGTKGFIPYNHVVAQTQTYVLANNSHLAKLAPYFTSNGFGIEWALAQTGLTKSDALILNNKNSAESWFTNLDTSKLTESFKIITGVNDEDLYQLVYNGMPSDKRANELTLLYLNLDDPKNCLGFENNAIINLTASRLKRIQNFITLSKKLNWSYSDLNTVLVNLEVKQNTEEADIITLAQISYLATAWSKSLAELEKMVNAIKLASDLHQQLIAITPLAKLLNCPIELTLPLFTGQTSFADVVKTMFSLQRQSEELDKVGINLQAFLSILALTKVNFLAEADYGKWLAATRKKLETSSINNTELNENQKLQINQAEFKQWVHELCVFTGLKELETYNVLCGTFEIHNIDDTTDFGVANSFFKQKADFNFFNKLIPHLLFLQKLNLDEASLQFIGSLVATYDSKEKIVTINELTDAKISDYCNYTFAYAQLNVAINKIEFVSKCWKKSNVGEFIKVMNWPEGNFKDLISSLKISDTAPLKASLTIATLAKLTTCFNYSQLTKIDVVSLYKYVQNLVSTDGTNFTEFPVIRANDANYKLYQNYYAQQLEHDRDALLPVALWQLNLLYSDIICPDHVSDYFLCDVEMAGIMNITPMREATDAVQTYLMRCKNGLEKVTLSINEDESKGISAKQWEWIPNFRIWQAEQMLKTYPENYLQPDVRSTATKQFKDMLNSLQGTQITNDKAETAALNYLDEWIDLLNADIIDASAYKTFSDYFQKEVETLFLISKSTVSDQTFYFSYKDTDIDNNLYHWAPWEEIPVKINAETVSSIYAFNRLHIFWTEQSSVTDTDPTIENGKYTLYSLTIKCIYQNIDGSWSVPQVILSFPFFLETKKHSTILNSISSTNGFTKKSQDKNRLYYNDKGVYLDKNDFKKVCTGTDSDHNKIQIGHADVISANNTTFLHFNSGEDLFIDNTNFEFVEDSNGLGKFVKVNMDLPSHEINIKDFNHTNLYFNKIGLLEVFEGGSSYIQVVMGPSYIGKGLPYYKINDVFFDFFCKNDSKLVSLKNTLNNNYYLANAAATAYPNSTVFAFQPVLLNHALTPVKDNVSISFKSETQLQNCKPTYTSTNISIDNYKEFVIDNYNGTLGITETNGSENKIFKTDLTNGVISKYFAVRNRPGAFYMEANQTGYLFKLNSNINNLDYLNAVKLDKDTIYYSSSFAGTNFSVERIFSTHLNQLRTNAQEKGMYIMNRDKYQNADIGYPKTTFSSLKPTDDIIPPATDSDNQIDFFGAFGIYAREQYFHAPMAIACLLQQQLQYDEVRKWYHFVYNSIGVANNNLGNVWQTNLFVAKVSKDSQNQILFNGRVLSNLKTTTDPYITSTKNNILFIIFKPDGNHLSIIKSIDCGRNWIPISMNWSQNESEIYGIEFDNDNQLVVYYFLPNETFKVISSDDGVNWNYKGNVDNIPITAKQQLIPLPFLSFKLVDSFDPDIISENNLAIYQYWTIIQYINFIIDSADNEFRQETWESLNTAIQLYFEAEDLLGQEPEVKDKVSEFEKNSNSRTFSSSFQIQFGTPTNTKIQVLWDKVKDRLYKLRNGLNINGERQMPSMYGTAIDPARLLLASQNGGINPYDKSVLTANRSVYRFREMAPHTESMINMVVEFGSQLHSALTQKDSEQLQVLQATHQINMLNVLNQTYQYQIDEAINEIELSKKNLESASNQKKYYDDLIEKGNFTTEIESIAANDTAASLQLVSAGIKVGASFGHFTPTIFGMADGGFQPGSAIDSIAGVSSELAQSSQTLSQILATHAEHVRRAEEWQFQNKQAQHSIDQINLNINSATIRLKIAQENMKQYTLQISQANEVSNYLKNKFTNAELYNWLSGQMSSLYFTAYQLASGSLHTLQAAYQYELDEQDNFIPSNAWNSLRKGLLAGEILKLSLARMQDAYLNKNKRRQEVEKIISLKAMKNYIPNNDKFDFNITLKDLGRDANKSTIKIKSISISIPAVVGPYETFDATLTNNKTYEQITISRGIEDMGVFYDELNDGRYLPFEGIKIDGSNSPDKDWTLNIPNTHNKNISDVILNIKFTVK